MIVVPDSFSKTLTRGNVLSFCLCNSSCLFIQTFEYLDRYLGKAVSLTSEAVYNGPSLSSMRYILPHKVQRLF
jgi:hypothetical protein